MAELRKDNGVEQKPIRIFLVDDHEIFRNGLRRLLNSRPGMEVVGEAENGRAATALVRQLLPNVVIMDVIMPDMNGIDATRKITEDLPGVKVVALSMHEDNRYIAGMLRAGASGFLLKDSNCEEIAEAIQVVCQNQTYLSPRISSIVISNYVNVLSGGAPEAAQTLTPREREVLQLLTEGMTAKAITVRLHLSKKTVESHRRSIRKKLNLHSMAELTRYAIRSGLTSVDC